MKEFKVGDIVLIGEVPDKKNYIAAWVPELDNYIGKTATIIKKVLLYEGSDPETGPYIYYLNCDDGRWLWSDENLTKIDYSLF